METNKSNKKFIAKLLAGLVTAATLAGFSYGFISDKVSKDDLVKSTPLETSIKKPTANTAYEKFYNDNIDQIKTIYSDLAKYKDLKDLGSSISKSREKELEDLTNKISGEYSEPLEFVVRDFLKAKFADMNGIEDYNDILISPEAKERIINIIDKRTNTSIMTFYSEDENKTQIGKTLFLLIDSQGRPNNTSLEKTQNANMHLALLNSAMKTSKNNYTINKSKDNNKDKKVVEYNFER